MMYCIYVKEHISWKHNTEVSSTSTSINNILDDILEEYADVFPEDLLIGLPPK